MQTKFAFHAILTYRTVNFENTLGASDDTRIYTAMKWLVQQNWTNMIKLKELNMVYSLDYYV